MSSVEQDVAPDPHARILYLEDDDDIRDAMVEFLTDAGYEVAAVSTAEAALGVLERERHHLLLTDYRLPLNNADWLLRTANSQDLLRTTAVIILSSESHPRGVDGYTFLRKPVDVAVLLATIGEALEVRQPGREAIAVSTAADVVHLRLYIAGPSEASRRARQNLQRILRSFDAARLGLEVFDVSTGDERWLTEAENDRILVTPTLVRRQPLPRVWVMGDLSRRTLVEEMIVSGLEIAKPSR